MQSANNSKNLFETVDYPESTRQVVLKKQFSTNSEILSLRFSGDDQLLAAGTLSGDLHIYHIHSGHRRFNLPLSNESVSAPCTSIRWSPLSKDQDEPESITTGDSNGNVTLWDARTGSKVFHLKEKENQIMSMDYNESGQFLATGGKDSTIRIYNQMKKQSEYQLAGRSYETAQQHQNRIFSLKFLPDSMNTLISGSWDQNINIWDLRQRKCAGSFIGGKICGDSVDYKNGQILVGANTATDQLKLFDFKERKLIQQIEYDKSIRENGAFVFAAQFSKHDNDQFAVCSSGKNEAKVFKSASPYSPIGAISKFSKGLYALDFANTQHKLATGGAEGLIVVFSTEPKSS